MTKVKETSAASHTPTPWKVHSELPDQIVTDDPEEILVCDLYTGAKVEDRANAAFIVRAVNCHEELLEIVRVLTGVHNCLPSGDEILLLCDRARKAIAKAEGK